MSDYRKTRTPGVYVRHRQGCPAADKDDARCRCKPSYRARRRDLGWSPTCKAREQAIEWKASAAARAENVSNEGPTFGELARLWWDGIENGSIGKRKGKKGVGYSETTLAGYRRSLFRLLLPAFENQPASELAAQFWQAWVDKQSRNGLSRSRIANHVAVVSAIYGWGSRANRQLVDCNPTTTVELPPNDEKPRERVASGEEAKLLLNALSPNERVPYALAFFAGLRRSEIYRLEWEDVDLNGLAITVGQAKSEAGEGRIIPIAVPLREILGEPREGTVAIRSVMSGKLAASARKAWKEAKLDLIGLHECRHTYASLLMAAGYNLKELMTYLGHADLATTSRYIKLLPQPAQRSAGDRLNRYLALDTPLDTSGS
jgi:integrase